MSFFTSAGLLRTYLPAGCGHILAASRRVRDTSFSDDTFYTCNRTFYTCRVIQSQVTLLVSGLTCELFDLGETQKGGYPGFLCIVFKAKVPIVHKGLFFFLAGHMSRSVDSPGQSFFLSSLLKARHCRV